MGNKSSRSTIFSYYIGQTIKLGDHKPRAESYHALKFEIKARRISILLTLIWIVGGLLWAWIRAHF